MKFTIQANIPEQQFMESMLNQKHSGQDVKLIFFFYALAHSWHISKLVYYSKLLEIGTENSSKTKQESK